MITLGGGFNDKFDPTTNLIPYDREDLDEYIKSNPYKGWNYLIERGPKRSIV
jgi:hypothetical protein